MRLREAPGRRRAAATIGWARDHSRPIPRRQCGARRDQRHVVADAERMSLEVGRTTAAPPPPASASSSDQATRARLRNAEHARAPAPRHGADQTSALPDDAVRAPRDLVRTRPAGWPSASAFSGTKNPPETNHSPTVQRLFAEQHQDRRAAGYAARPDAARPRGAAGVTPRRSSANAASATERPRVTGHASYRSGRQAADGASRRPRRPADAPRIAEPRGRQREPPQRRRAEQQRLGHRRRLADTARSD